MSQFHIKHAVDFIINICSSTPFFNLVLGQSESDELVKYFRVRFNAVFKNSEIDLKYVTFGLIKKL